jgi:hypothetical protein
MTACDGHTDNADHCPQSTGETFFDDGGYMRPPSQNTRILVNPLPTRDDRMIRQGPQNLAVEAPIVLTYAKQRDQ